MPRVWQDLPQQSDRRPPSSYTVCNGLAPVRLRITHIGRVAKHSFAAQEWKVVRLPPLFNERVAHNIDCTEPIQLIQ
jgi:hypothetical protein